MGRRDDELWGPLLGRERCAGDALDVAHVLLGAVLRRGTVALRITEVEAYRWPDDSANHCRAGRTPRNAPMWGPPGRAYVYLCYGIHHLLNIVTNPEGEGAAVLIRAAEPVAGLPQIRRRRKTPGGAVPDGPALLAGPGRVAAALGLTVRHSGEDVCRPGGLELREPARIPSPQGAAARSSSRHAWPVAPADVLCGPRVGIDYALPEHRDAPWRLALAGTEWVTKPTGLAPLHGQHGKPGSGDCAGHTNRAAARG